MGRYTLIFDIETVPTREENLSEEELEYLFKRADSEEKREKIRGMMSFWALTAHLVSVGMFLLEKKRALVLYVGDEEGEEVEDVDGVEVRFRSFPLSEGIEEAERRILEEFWRVVSSRSVGRLVSFNGRGFDSHFLMLKSLMLGVKATRSLMGNRYDYGSHLDILDLLSFHGVGRLYSLDFLCRRLGIDTPKKFMKAEEVNEKFLEGKYREIALYNFYDILATGRLYERLVETLGEALGLTP